MTWFRDVPLWLLESMRHVPVRVLHVHITVANAVSTRTSFCLWHVFGVSYLVWYALLLLLCLGWVRFLLLRGLGVVIGNQRDLLLLFLEVI